MIPVAGYCRVSTDHTDQIHSLETQKQYFREYIQTHPGWILHEIYADEGITGTSTKKRTQFNRMMCDAYKGKFRMILTKEVSRFSRNILDTIACTRELRALGIGVIFATDQINTLEPEAEMLLSFLASIAQEESRRTSARVIWGQTRQMEKGVVFGGSLLGYRVKNGILSVNPEEAEVVRLIFRKYTEEQMCTSQIARFLTGAGYRTGRGNTAWTSGSIIRILKNEKYVGDLIQKKTYTPDYLTHSKKANRGQVPMITITDHHEPIIRRELWNLTQDRLQRNNKHKKGESSHSNRYVFSGKIKCGQCGSSFVGRIRYRKDGTRIRRWSCSTAAREGAGVCSVGKLVRDDDALQMLQTALRSLSMDFDAVIRNVTELALEAILAGQVTAWEEPDRVQQELDRVQQKKEAVMDAYFSREITKEDMLSMTEKYARQLTGLRKRLDEALLRKEHKQDCASLRSGLLAQVTALLTGETESDVFYKTVLESLTVFKDRHLELRLKLLPQVFWFTG